MPSDRGAELLGAATALTRKKGRMTEETPTRFSSEGYRICLGHSTKEKQLW